MIVKDILIECANCLDREDLITFYQSGVAVDYATACKDASVLLNAYNLVQEDISCSYLKFENTEIFNVKNGKIPFTDFKYLPIEILSVCDAFGNKIKHSISNGSINVDFSKVEITYVYAFESKGVNDLSGFELTPITQRILAYGTAAEYCLIKGMYEEASTFHSKYVESLSNALNKTKSIRVKCREWK